MRIVIAAIALSLTTACLQAREGPPLPTQVRVSYGSRIYLADHTPAQTLNDRVCGRMTNLLTNDTTTQTVDELIADAAFDAVDGRESITDRDVLRRPQTCFVPVVDNDPAADRAGTLLVDQIEVTNELYQFCVDSGFCFEPDPSAADQNDICTEEGQDNGFFECPAVEIPLTEARRFCQYIGRRLPTAIESILIRQAAWAAEADGTRSPESMRVYPALPPPADPTTIGSTDQPQDCSDAHLEARGCGRPTPLDPNEPEGSASDDAITDSVTGEGPIYDLTGHVAEWAGDGFPNEDDLPWFCLGPVDRDPADNSPVCPSLAIPGDSDLTFRTGCVYGYYDPNDLEGRVELAMFGDQNSPTDDLPYGLYPVCVIGSTARFAGRNGYLFGGTWRDEALDLSSGNTALEVDPDLAGTFGHRIERAPAEPEDTILAQQYGLRCVDDREPGLDENGDGFPFESVPDGGDEPGPQIDIDFQP